MFTNTSMHIYTQYAYRSWKTCGDDDARFELKNYTFMYNFGVTPGYYCQK